MRCDCPAMPSIVIPIFTLTQANWFFQTQPLSSISLELGEFSAGCSTPQKRSIELEGMRITSPSRQCCCFFFAVLPTDGRTTSTTYREQNHMINCLPDGQSWTWVNICVYDNLLGNLYRKDEVWANLIFSQLGQFMLPEFISHIQTE